MGNRRKYLADPDRNFEDGASLLSILFEAAAYGSPVSTDANPGIVGRRHSTVATGNIEIGDGLRIKVNGLKNWAVRAAE